MFIKSIVTVCLFSVALAGLVPVKRSYEYSAPPPAPAHWEKEHWKPANYEFQYDVNDHHTGDIKEQHEKAENGKVTGHYSLVEPDGLHRRIVEYTADAEHGFVANVRLEPYNDGSHKPQISPEYIPAPPPPVNQYIPPARKW